MQFYGIGTDIIKIERIAKLWDKWGMNFATRILSTHELEILKQMTQGQDAFLAKRFAAKEAVVKALGTGFRDKVYITQVGIETDLKGKPVVVFYGETKKYIDTLGNLDIQISLSDEADYVIVFVIILKK